MASDDIMLFESGDLSICLELREVRNSRGESARLGPVNMNVLGLLVSRRGQVVSRNELFDAVWKNQIVSDDVLTRCISDIRAQLSRLSENNTYIETLPKLGYRWMADVRTTSPSTDSAGDQAVGRKPAAEQARASLPQPVLLHWAGRALIYSLALVLVASISVWLMNQLARTDLPTIAVLPIQGEASRHDIGANIESRLSDSLMSLDRIDLLSRSAVESRPNNPFPYFHYEFGARWLVESELRSVSGQTMLTVVLVDARTGIVLFQSTESIGNDGSRTDPDIGQVVEPLERFIESQLGR